MNKYTYILFVIFFLLGQSLKAQLILDADGPGSTYSLITSKLAPNNDPIEVPDCGHAAFGDHIDELFDATLNTNVFRFHIHVSDDDDRCINFDRQRNEIKVYDQSPDSLFGISGETVEYKWKFQLDAGFQSSANFTHIHQLKAVGGTETSTPSITLTTRKGTPDQLELRYAQTTSQTTLLSTDLTAFKGTWVEVTETVTYGEDGAYAIEIKKVSDGTTMFTYSNSSIRMWKTGATFIRPKWGIYRSLLNSADLRDEEVLFANFSIEELSAVATWDGGAGTNNWTDALNWDTNVVPSASDTVIITGSSVTVSYTGTSTVAKVFVESNAQLTIESGATLTINGANTDSALETSPTGTIVNNGTVNITNVTNSQDGIYSKGTFTNNGTISVDGVAQHGVYLQGGTFTNSSGATLSVTNATGDYIYTDDASGTGAIFNNNGTITLTITTGDDGIYVNDGSTFNNASIINVSATGGDDVIFAEDAGIFNNNSGGTITINSAGDNGIYTKLNGVINNNSGGTINIGAVTNDQISLDATTTFTNAGTLNLTNGSDIGLYITDASTFTNSSTGQLNITDATKHCIQIDANSEGSPANLNNSGTITLINNSNLSGDIDAVRLQEGGTLTINSGASLSISGADDEAIQLDDPSTLTNNGTITITSPTDHGMEILGTVNNGGILNMTTVGDVGLYLITSGTFNNTGSGAVTITSPTNHGIQIDANSNGSPATLTNSAAITVANGSADGLRMQESGVFTNNSGATLTFTNSGDESIQLDNPSTLTNNGTVSITSSTDHGMEIAGTVNNGGILNMTTVGDVGLYLITSGAFNNTGSGAVTITSPTNYGIQIDANSNGSPATLTNSAAITIANGNTDGLRMQESGVFTNNSGATLTFTNSGDESIQLDNPSTLTNNGTIEITSSTDHGMEILGTVNNGGTLNMTTVGDIGLYLNTSGTFNNTGSGAVTITSPTNYGIQIDANSNGSPATLTNSAAITIANGGTDGLRMQESGVFTNNSGATLTFTNSGDESIQLDNPSTLTNNGTIEITSSTDHGMEILGTVNNGGTLNMTTVGDVGLYLNTSGTFNNTGSGAVTITSPTNYGIQIDANSNGSPATLTNSAAITIANGGTDGLRMQESGVFTNNSGATLTFTNSGDESIQLDNPSTLTNNGTINITSPTDHGMEILGTVSNGGALNMTTVGDIGLYILTSASFTNTSTGTVTITSPTNYCIQIDANSNGSPATLINSGTITTTNGIDGLRLQEGAGFTNNSGANLTINSPSAEGINFQSNAGTVTNSGTVTITGSGSGVAPGDNGIEMAGGTFTNSSGATLTITNIFDKGILTNGGIINNTGTIDISNTGEEGMDMNTGGTFNNNNGGVFKVVDGVADNLEVNSGCIVTNDGDMQLTRTTDGSGRDDIEFNGGTFTNNSNATFSPGGTSVGEIEVRGDFDLGSSTVTFNLKGTTHTTEFDRIETVTNSTSTITLTNATMHLNWSYIPSVGDKFKVIDGASTISGTFKSITTSNSNITTSITYIGNSNTEVEITVDAVTPVELVHFTGEKTDRGVKLSWATASEENNEGFEIERSNNGTDWSKIGYVRGNGNSLDLIEYAYLDETPIHGTNYYRLKQLDLPTGQGDFDSQFEYSNVVSLIFINDKKEFALYPNPVQGDLNIINGKGQAIIYNILNQPIKSFNIQYPAFNIDLSDLPKGQYILHIQQDNGNIVTQQFIK